MSRSALCDSVVKVLFWTKVMAEHSILLVDPSENVLNVYKAILAETYLVGSASSLKEALGLLKTREYSVMITEYSPEDQAAHHMLDQVKKLAPETYVIVVTNSLIDDATYQRLYELGLDDIVLKPCSPQRILAHIRKGLRYGEIIPLLDPVVPRIAGLIKRSVFNSVFFKERLRQEMKKAKRHDHPFSLLLIPIPSREKVGDRCESFYQELAKILSRHVREEDIVGRENGHFGILLPDTDQKGSQALMDRLLKLIHSHPLFRTDEPLSSGQPHHFQSFTYPGNFNIPEPLRAVLSE